MTLKEYGEAVRAERRLRNMSRNKLARIAGCGVDAVRALEDGERAPTKRVLARMLGALPRLRGVSLPQCAGPADFAAALASAREGAGLSRTELAELVGVSESAVTNWESRGYCPIKIHYERLLDLLPDLLGGPEPSWRDMEKPGPVSSPAVVVLATRQVPALPAARTEAAQDPVTLGMAYAAALSRALAAAVARDEAASRLAALEKEVEDAEAAATEAHAALRAAALAACHSSGTSTRE